MIMEVHRELNTLVIRLPLRTPCPSASGKTLIVATTKGPKITTVHIEEKPVTISLNAYIERD